MGGCFGVDISAFGVLDCVGLKSNSILGIIVHRLLCGQSSRI